MASTTSKASVPTPARVKEHKARTHQPHHQRWWTACPAVGARRGWGVHDSIESQFVRSWLGTSSGRQEAIGVR